MMMISPCAVAAAFVPVVVPSRYQSTCSLIQFDCVQLASALECAEPPQSLCTLGLVQWPLLSDVTRNYVTYWSFLLGFLLLHSSLQFEHTDFELVVLSTISTLPCQCRTRFVCMQRMIIRHAIPSSQYPGRSQASLGRTPRLVLKS